LIIGVESRWWMSGEDDFVVDCDELGVFSYLSLKKLITTFWLVEEERVLVVCELRSSSPRRTDVFAIV
jgi:hypothetical protein